MLKQQLIVKGDGDEITTTSDEFTLKDVMQVLQQVKGDTEDIKITLNSMEERITTVEDKVGILEDSVAQNSKDIQHLQDQVNELKRADSLKNKRITSLEKKNVLEQLYGRRMNILIHGQAEIGSNESKENSHKLIDGFLRDTLNLDLSSLVIVDGHRLPQKPKSNPTGPRPLIFKVATLKMKDSVFAAVRDFNKDKDRNDQVKVSTHLPQLFQDQRKKLLPQFIEARKAKKDAKFSIDFKHAEYYLNIEGVSHYATD